MTERPCIRCHNPVAREDGHLSFCSHCGAPQIFLPEERQAELAEANRTFQEREAAEAAPAVPAPDAERPARRRWPSLAGSRGRGDASSLRPWPLGIRSALLSTAIAFALGLTSLLLPPAGLLLIVWIIAAPTLTVGFFHARFGARPAPGTSFAARLGLLTGLLVVCCCAVVFSLSLVLTRYVFHDAGALDAQLAATFAQQRSLLVARMGSEVQPALDLLATPEYRVGLLLSVLATSAAIYLLLSSLAAAVADVLLRRRRGLPG